MEGWPEAVAGTAEVAADGGGVEAGVDAGEKDDEVFGDEIRDALVVRGEELGFGGFPGGGKCSIHKEASQGVFWQLLLRGRPRVPAMVTSAHSASASRAVSRPI